MGFLNTEDFNNFIEKINSLENIESSITNLQEEIHALKIGIFEEDHCKNLDTLKQYSDNLSKNIESINSLKQEKQNILQTIDNNKHNLGEEIRINFDDILSDTTNFVHNTLPGGRTIANIKKTVSDIESFLSEIKLYTHYLEKINQSTGTLLNPINITHVSQNETNNSKPFSNHNSIYPLNEYILDSKLDFGEFSLNSKTGYSLKDFFQLHEDKIKFVMKHFNFNKENVIAYFKKYHGLCNGETIHVNTWNTLCYMISCNVSQKNT